MPESIPESNTNVNADLSLRVVTNTHGMSWEPSPSGSVWRKPLYRFGGELGPVTSLVRYALGGAFREHTHPEGEEILVLDGVFSDEHGDYPAGTFLMNPHGSRHSPRSDGGCTLFVRLRQYPGEDRPRLQEDTRAQDGWLRVWSTGSVYALSTPRAVILRMSRSSAGLQAPIFSATPIGAARRSWCWRGSLPMSTAGTRRAPGFAARI